MFPTGPAFRLYAILDIDMTIARGLTPAAVADAWLNAGVRLIQLRAKSLSAGPMLELAEDLAARTHAAGATFIVNDRADVARMAGADGVHVGQDDLSPEDVRRVVGLEAIVGLSTHGLAQLEAAVEGPIDYLAIGPVFGTSTKTNPDPVVGVEAVRRGVEAAKGRPVVAIGGITLDRAAEVIGSGAAAVAVIADLLLGDPGRRAADYLAALR